MYAFSQGGQGGGNNSLGKTTENHSFICFDSIRQINNLMAVWSTLLLIWLQHVHMCVLAPIVFANGSKLLLD